MGKCCSKVSLSKPEVTPPFEVVNPVSNVVVPEKTKASASEAAPAPAPEAAPAPAPEAAPAPAPSPAPAPAPAPAPEAAPAPAPEAAPEAALFWPAPEPEHVQDNAEEADGPAVPSSPTSVADFELVE